MKKHEIKPNENLRGANLREADLRGADLSDTNLRRADLRKANLINADLSGADLKGSDLSGAELYTCKGVMAFTAGESNRLCFTYRYNDTQYYQLGCFNGTYSETVEAIREKYGIDSSYEGIVTAYRGVV